jgi:D-aminoacyl-tRNA deacylase
MELIVTSQQDPAGTNMYNLLAKEFGFVQDGEFDGRPMYKKEHYVLINVKKTVLELEYLNEHFSPEIYLVGSKHKSEKKVKSLTCHTPGNWSKADFGGNEKELCVSHPLYLHAVLQELKKFPDPEYIKCYEVTHHGPSSMNAPILFAEVGGSEEEWNNIDACRAVCNALLAQPMLSEAHVANGFGGPHYAPNFSKLTHTAIGHICPKYQLDNVDDEIVIQSFEKTFPRAKFAVIDWKGCTKEQRDKLISIFEKNHIEWKRIKDVD